MANPTQPSRLSSALASSMSAGHSQRSDKSSIINVCRKRKRKEESQQLQKKWKLDEEDARHGYEDTSGPNVTLPASYKPLRSLKLPKSLFSDEGDSNRDESNILRDSKKRKSPDQLDSEHPQKKQRFNPEHNCDGKTSCSYVSILEYISILLN
ncbi:MAG: hypothetical protein ACRCTP_06280 [Aeromonas popoffii]|uniref:hypothetical protein n=1 Tax=Aeromonas popoffii TaxID=70856 RepID=UPI003F2A438C